MLAPLVFLMAVRPVQAQSVSLELPGVTVETLVRKVNEATGSQDSVDEKVGQEVVAVLVKDMPVEQLKGLVAKVVYGKWVGDKLVSDEERIKEEQRAEDAAFLKDVREGRRFCRMLADGYSVDPNDRRRSTLILARSQEPDEREVFQIAASVPEEAWMALKDRERVVLSTNPTGAQMKLDVPGLSEIVSRQIGVPVSDPRIEDRKWFPEAFEIQSQMTSELAKLGLRTEGVGPVKAYPAKVLFILTDRGLHRRYEPSAQLVMFDQRGHAVYTKSVPMGSTIHFMPEKIKAMKDEEALKQGLEQLDASETSNLKVRLVTESGEDDSQSEIAGFAKLAANPDWTIQSYLMGRSAVAYAKFKKKQIVCGLDDDYRANIHFTKASSIRSELWGSQLPTEINGVLVRPTSLQSMSQPRQSDFRKALAVCQRHEGTSLNSLDSIAAYDYALAMSDPRGQFDSIMGRQLSKAILNRFDEMDRLGMRVWGSMSDVQHSQLRGGGKILVSSLPKKFQTYLWSALQESPYRYWYMPDARKYEPWVLNPIGGCGVGMETTDIFDYFDEATEVFPNGMPSSAYLEFESRESLFCQIADDGDEPRYRNLCRPDEVCFDLDLGSSRFRDFDIQAVRVRRSVLRLTMAQNLGQEFVFIERLGKAGAPFKIDNAPAAFQRELDDSHKRMVASRMYQLKKQFDEAIKIGQKRLDEAGGGG